MARIGRSHDMTDRHPAPPDGNPSQDAVYRWIRLLMALDMLAGAGLAVYGLAVGNDAFVVLGVALAAIGAAVHFLDIGGIPVADAKGLETLLRGAKERAKSDDALLAEAMRVLDLLYSAYRGGLRTAAPR